MSDYQESYNKGGLIAFIGSMAFSIGFIIYLCFIHPGVEEFNEVKGEAAPTADAKPLAGGGDTPAPSFDINSIAKPWVSDDKVADYGKTVYKTSCEVCHGATYQGDGVAGKALVPPPRNFVAGGWKKGSRSMDLYKTISEGLPGTSMVGFKQLSKADRWALVQLIRSVTKDKKPDNAAELEKFAASAE